MARISFRLPSWLRTLLIGGMIGGGAVLILFPAWLPEKPSMPAEDGTVELLQSALLAFTAALFFATASHAGSYHPVYRSFGFLALAALIAESSDTIDAALAPLGHEIPLMIVLVIAIATLMKNQKKTLHFIGFAARNPASGFLISATILVYAFSRVFGSNAFWSATLDGNHHPDTPQVCRAYLELLACYFILLGGIGFCLPQGRRRHHMVTEP